jgi:hypothetical protein
MTVHLRNPRRAPSSIDGRAAKTWCGKTLHGTPTRDGVMETFTSYGAETLVTADPDAATCERCSAAFDAAYAEAFPGGPKPLATFKLDDPADVERCRSIFGAAALTRTFGPGGGGLAEIEAKLREPSS